MSAIFSLLSFEFEIEVEFEFEIEVEFEVEIVVEFEVEIVVEFGYRSLSSDNNRSRSSSDNVRHFSKGGMIIAEPCFRVPVLAILATNHFHCIHGWYLH